MSVNIYLYINVSIYVYEVENSHEKIRMNKWYPCFVSRYITFRYHPGPWVLNIDTDGNNSNAYSPKYTV